MEKGKFTHNLIKIAFCSMACDSDIDKSEITKINEIVEKDFYFDGHSLSKDINFLKKDLDKKGPILIEKILNEQLFLNYSESQKIIIIEVSIGIIKADKKLEIHDILSWYCAPCTMHSHQSAVGGDLLNILAVEHPTLRTVSLPSSKIYRVEWLGIRF